nr:CheR family methyltransferase [Rubellimicrobium arenae]
MIVRARLAERFRKLVHETTGIFLPDSKDGMIESRLRSRLVALGLRDVGEYFHYLFEKGALQDELPRIIEAVTTNKTDFFRERAHYAFLWETMIPAALKAAPGRVPFKFWSAASSTGAEAWSAAMVLAEAQAHSPQLDWDVLGTDISRRVLQTAGRAIYPEAELEPVPAALRDRYAMVGRGRDGAPLRRIVPELRQRVRFQEMNLMDPSYPVDRNLDAIFLRNVLIYFDPPTQARVIASISSHLRPGGHLVVGHAESMIVRQNGLRQVAPAVFVRERGDGAPVPRDVGPRHPATGGLL